MVRLGLISDSWFTACLNRVVCLCFEEEGFGLEHVPCSKLGKSRPHTEDSLLYSQNFKSPMIDFPSEMLI